MLSIENVSKSYEGKQILKDVCMNIDDGEIVSIYGESGIGKSTLAKIICGVLKPGSGNVLLDGMPLYGADGKYDRKRGLCIQMVYQQPFASFDLNQRIGKAFNELIKYHGFADEGIKSVLESVGLDESIQGHRVNSISGGEAQRLALARALLFNPKVLVMDEASSMLDVLTQAQIFGLVKKNIVQKGGSILLISHDRELVNFMSDRIYVLENAVLKETTE